MEETNPHIRVGLVAYMNVQPLVWAFHKGLISPTTPDGRRMVFFSEIPRLLANSLREGRCHVGIVPVYEYFAGPEYSILPAGAIATKQRVGSVLIVANAPLENLEFVVLDPASLTSVNLLRLLHAEFGWRFKLVEYPLSDDPMHAADWLSQTHRPAGQLLIGDPALAAYARVPYVYDLGSLWYELTGLPFVFAAWLVSPAIGDVPLLETFTRARKLGEVHLDEVARECAPVFGFAADFASRYFRENLHFALGDDEIAGLREFGRLLAHHGLIESPRELRFYMR
ncbi:MAG: menaquinone biosynthetic enzyme MqnA/MqnD family protein [Candidatus Sumerlaeaceae bacterium]|jgi:chorismate dehydratase